MKHLLLILLAAILCATASAQTIRTLGYNTTNNTVVGPTNTNALVFTNNVRIGSDLFVSGENNTVRFLQSGDQSFYANYEEGALGQDDLSFPSLYWRSNYVEFLVPIQFSTTGNAATSRTNLGLPLAALTNTSNVTIMRALSGSTNTNEPYSGTFYAKDNVNDDVEVIISNGIILRIEK